MVRVSKAKLWKAIRKTCLDCVGGSSLAVQNCSGGYTAEGEKLGTYRCELFPYRFGKTEKEAIPTLNPQNSHTGNAETL